MRPMRIAIVAPGFAETRDEPGLPAVVDLVERLASVADVELVALRYPPRGEPYRVAGAVIRSLALGRTHGPVGRARVLGGGLRAVIGIHRRRPVDLVHGLWADEAGAVAVLAGRLLGRPSVVSVLGGELVALPDIGYGAALGRGGRLTTGLALRLARVVTCGSAPLADDIRRAGRPAPLVLPLGVDLGVFAPDANARAGPRTILFVGSLEPVKDPGLLLRAFAALAGDRPDLRLRVVGDGRLRAGLAADAASLGLSHRVAFDGSVARRDLPAIYRAATVLAVPSRHEAQSVVAVEAAACGLPVVGSRVGAVAEVAEAGAALAIAPTDEQGLIEALATVVDDADRAAEMGRAGRTMAVERWDIGATSAAVLELYERLVSRPVTAGPPGDA